ncbi:D-alanyl-D-alanine carboxypeptidase [Christensenellaceae bacterium OttesenSCG-928-M15]|nr:D-alanyl-D-alanine carboxypeptidase [Christensenellaceae bacterium OttesenSCG-928-M15]
MKRPRLLFFLVLLCAFMPVAAHASALDEDAITAEHVILIEGNTNTVLYEKNADDMAYPASTTKVMTSLLTLELGNLDDTVKVPAVTDRGSLMGIRRGETMSLRSLLYGMMLVSGNDAAEAIAVHLGESKDGFVALMNEKANALGLKNTHFVNPHGLHKEEHYTTARDFAQLTRYALVLSPQKEDYRAMARRATYTVNDSSKKTYALESTNKLIHTREKNGVKRESFEYRNAIGLKTGDTPVAEKCLVAAAERGDTLLIAIIFKERDADKRFVEAAALFDYGFEQFTKENAAALSLPTEMELPPSGDEDAKTLSVALENIEFGCLKDELAAIKSDPGRVDLTLLNSDTSARGASMEVAYSLNGKVLFTAPAHLIEPAEAVPLPDQNGSTQAPPPSIDAPGSSGNTAVWYVLSGIVILAGAAYCIVRFVPIKQFANPFKHFKRSQLKKPRRHSGKIGTKFAPKRMNRP